MAIVVGSGAYASFVSNNGSTNEYFFYSDWSGNDDPLDIRTRNFTISSWGTWGYNAITTASSGAWYTTLSGSNPSGIAMDVLVSWYPWLFAAGGGNFYGSTRYFVSYVIAATANAPSVGSITSSSASVNCTYTPNTSYSTCSAQLQYKRTVDSTWTNFGSAVTTGGFGSTSVGATSLTGLLANTSYDVRLQITRTTSANTTTTSATTSFTTLVGAPTITTDAATVVTNSSANLNATLTINAGAGVAVYWKYDTVDPPVATTTASQAASADGSFTVNITGLSQLTTYYFQAFTSFSSPSGSPAQGSVVSFTTAVDPAAVAAQEDHMLQFSYDRKYGAATTVYFTLASPSGTSSDRYITSAVGTWHAAGDVKVSIDGAADATATNTPTQVEAAKPLYALALTAAEMSGEDIMVKIVDQGGPLYRDALIHIRTKQRLGQVVVDAGALTDTTAVTYTGVGTGHGLSCVGGATGLDIDGVLGQMSIRFNTAQAGGASTITLDAGANATNDWYKGQIVTIVANTGAGQSRVITSYVGATKVATVDSAWSTNPDVTSLFLLTAGDRMWDISPGAELSAVPTYASSYAKLLQFLFQRFAYKRTQTATVFTMTKVDDATSFATAGVSDNGTTETHNRIS